MTTVDAAVESATDGAAARIGRSAPSTGIDVRHDAAGGVVITVAGAIGRNDAAVLSRHLHTALDSGSTVIVVNLSRVPSCDGAGREVLATARERARDTGVGLHLVHVGPAAGSDWFADAGLAS